MTNIPPRPGDTEFWVRLLAVLERLEQRLARRDRLDDEYRKIYLNARFPYGKPDDRWAPR